MRPTIGAQQDVEIQTVNLIAGTKSNTLAQQQRTTFRMKASLTKYLQPASMQRIPITSPSDTFTCSCIAQSSLLSTLYRQHRKRMSGNAEICSIGLGRVLWLPAKIDQDERSTSAANQTVV